MSMNNQLVLIGGASSMGKSASLRNIPNQEKWMYLNTEAGKELPFANKFQAFTIIDPYQVFEAFDVAIANPDKYDGIIIDSLTFLMDMFESRHVLTATNTMNAWSEYAQYFKKLMQEYVVRFNKPTLILAHTLDTDDMTNPNNIVTKTAVPIKGALKNQGIEAYFSTVVSAKRVPVTTLEGYESDLLTINEDEKEDGVKHVFQTRITKYTTGERIRSPMGLFSRKETFIDNDVVLLLDRMKTFYGNN